MPIPEALAHLESFVTKDLQLLSQITSQITGPPYFFSVIGIAHLEKGYVNSQSGEVAADIKMGIDQGAQSRKDVSYF